MLDDDTIDMPKVLNELNYMKKIQEIKNKYKDKIKHRKDDQRVYVYVNRRFNPRPQERKEAKSLCS